MQSRMSNGRFSGPKYDFFVMVALRRRILSVATESALWKLSDSINILAGFSSRKVLRCGGLPRKHTGHGIKKYPRLRGR